MALATVKGLSFAYPGEHEALRDVSLELEPGEVVALLGPSGGGKSTLLRALAGLVPHFHGGRFAGSVFVAGMDTRLARPADLAGTVATLFQDPEDQVVFTRVSAEVAFGLENLGTPPERILPRVAEALASVGAAHLAERPVAELSGGELQRVCLASVLALRPQLLLLDEPTSQLDPDGAAAAIELARESGAAVVVSEQRPERVLQACDRVVFVEEGRLSEGEPPAAWWPRVAAHPAAEPAGPPVCRLEAVSFAYDAVPVLEQVDLRLGRGEVVALVGPNGSGKTTLAKLAAGLLEPQAGSVEREGRACYLSQDPGRYLVKERADEEVALAVGGDLERARAALARWAWPASRIATRAISRAASGSGSRSPPCSSPSRICWSSTSRPAASTRRARTNSQRSCALRRPAGRRSSSPTTMSSRARSPTASSRRCRSGSGRLPRLAAFAALTAAVAAAAWTVLDPADAALALLLVAGALIVAGAAWLESGPGSSKELVLIATLAAAAAAGRVLFAAVPNVQPVTVIAVVAGVALGPRAGASVGALAALVSNFYLGQGAYTPWQMLAWGGCGLIGGLAAPLLRRRLPLALTCFALGFAFDAFMDVWEWLSFYPHTWQAFTALYLRGIWFDGAHATGNFVLALVAGPELRRLLERYARRLKAVVVWA